MMRRRLIFLVVSMATLLGGLHVSSTRAQAALTGTYRVYLGAIVLDQPLAAMSTWLPNPQESEALRLINQERARAGCAAPLILAIELGKSARAHSEDMAATGTLSHTGSDGSNFSTRAQLAGFSGFAGGEIIGAGYASAAEIVSAWLNSSVHRAIMLDCSYKVAGAGYVYAPTDTQGWKHYWTVVFGW